MVFLNKLGFKKGLKQTALRLCAAAIVFVVLLDILPTLFTKVDTFNRQVEQVEQSETTLLEGKNNQGSSRVNDNNKSPQNDTNTDKNVEVKSDNTAVYKGFAWLKGLVKDLGIGFGWAAFYFTMFTALWYGQTPGKKLFSIRVIQLDGTQLSVWDSFGRYGGYVAGIATGLLGFVQIFWDPNRQAIHDKISATIVVSNKDMRQHKANQTNTVKIID